MSFEQNGEKVSGPSLSPSCEWATIGARTTPADQGMSMECGALNVAKCLPDHTCGHECETKKLPLVMSHLRPLLTFGLVGDGRGEVERRNFRAQGDCVARAPDDIPTDEQSELQLGSQHGEEVIRDDPPLGTVAPERRRQRSSFRGGRRPEQPARGLSHHRAAGRRFLLAQGPAGRRNAGEVFPRKESRRRV